jgi:predicted nuclease with TOPRIM domain
MLADGIMVTMMRISIALLKKNEEHILNQNELELILGCLKGQKLLEIYSDNYDSLIKDTIALSKHITTSLLDDIKDRYLEEEEKCAVAVTKRELEFMKSQIIELKSKLDKRDETIKELKSNNSLLDDKVLGQQQKLARIEKENAHLNAENIELRKLLHDHDLIVKQP